MHPYILPPWCLLQPANHSARFAAYWPTKNEQVRKRPKCWPTFWTHDKLLFANIVGKQMLANICLSCVRGFTDSWLHLHWTNACGGECVCACVREGSLCLWTVVVFELNWYDSVMFLGATDACACGRSSQLYASCSQSEQSSWVAFATETQRSFAWDSWTTGLWLTYVSLTGLCACVSYVQSVSP